MSATPFSVLRAPLRICLEDTDATTYQWADDTLNGAMAHVLNTGRVSIGDPATVYRYSDDGLAQATSLGVTPNVLALPGDDPANPSGDPNAYTLLLLRTVQTLILPRSAAQHVGTRAVKASRGPLSEWLRTLEMDIYDIERGQKFDQWSTFPRIGGITPYYTPYGIPDYGDVRYWWFGIPRIVF